MSQNSVVIPNTSGAAFRTNVNNAFNTLITQNSGATAPTTTYAYMLWADTTLNLLRLRDSTNTNWLTLGPIDGAWSGKGAALASSATVTLGLDGNVFHLTGTASITKFSGKQPWIIVIFDGAAILVHHATDMILQNQNNFSANVGDAVMLVREGTDQFREVNRHLATAIPGPLPMILAFSMGAPVV